MGRPLAALTRSLSSEEESTLACSTQLYIPQSPRCVALFYQVKDNGPDMVRLLSLASLLSSGSGRRLAPPAVLLMSSPASSISIETIRRLQGAQLFVGSAIAYLCGVRRMQARRSHSTQTRDNKGEADTSKPKKSGIYTRTGDGGTSQLFNGERRAKDDQTFEALGATDELNASIGLAREYCTHQNGLEDYLAIIQSRLLDMGAAIATPVQTSSESKRERTRFDHSHVEDLEKWVDSIDQRLPQLKNFILPSGGLCSAHLHVSRTVCRRAERAVIPLVQSGQVDPEVGVYLNRLSDFLFVAARWAAKSDGHKETVWRKA